MINAADKIWKKEAEAPEKGEFTRERRLYTPSVDIIERKDDIVVIADMPGVDEKSIDITLEKNVLTIYGTVKADIPENNRLIVSEYGMGDYQRVFTLPDEIDKNNIQATVDSGVLNLTLRKAESARTRKIPVTVGV